MPPALQPTLTEFLKNPEAAKLYEAFWKAGGTLSDDAAGDAAAFYGYIMMGNDKVPPVITININKGRTQAQMVGTLLFELIRFEHRHDDAALDKSVSDGSPDPEDYALHSEEDAYNYMLEHHSIATSGGWTAKSDSYDNTLKNYPTFEEWLVWDKSHNSCHYYYILNLGRSMAPKKKPEVVDDSTLSGVGPTGDEGVVARRAGDDLGQYGWPPFDPSIQYDSNGWALITDATATNY